MATRKALGQTENQNALLIWEVFTGQCTEKVNEFLENLNVKVVTVTANMTHIF